MKYIKIKLLLVAISLIFVQFSFAQDIVTKTHISLSKITPKSVDAYLIEILDPTLSLKDGEFVFIGCLGYYKIGFNDYQYRLFNFKIFYYLNYLGYYQKCYTYPKSEIYNSEYIEYTNTRFNTLVMSKGF